MQLTTAAAIWAILPMTLLGVNACSRVNYNSGKNDSNRIVVGRTMDWMENTREAIWLFPAGMQRTGRAGSNSLNWTSKYGSVMTSFYNFATVDGMNSKGLVGNNLYLSNSDYGKRNMSLPGLSVAAWVQYYLDNYATVSEAVSDTYTKSGAERFQCVTKEILPGVRAVAHLGLTDATGDSAIFEYIDGKLVIHHGSQYNVLTNEPSFDQQLAINEYWADIANVSLPGTERPADRFARLSYYIKNVPGASDSVSAASHVMGLVRAVSVPLEPASVESPNVAPTLYRTYSDTKAMRYYYEGSFNKPMMLWIEMNKLDLSRKGTVKVLTVNGTWSDRFGDMTTQFVKAEPFQFLDTSV